MSKKPKPRAGGTVTTIGLLPATWGYEVFDPNDETATPREVIGWLINEENGANVTHPITVDGDAPDGWLVRYRGMTYTPGGELVEQQGT